MARHVKQTPRSRLSIAYRQPCRQPLTQGPAAGAEARRTPASTCGKIAGMNRPTTTGRTIGILALQGDYEAHRKVLEEKLHVETAEVRTPKELQRVDALILPGGESTTIAKLLKRIE